MPNVKIYKTNALPSSGMEADAIYLVKDGTAFFMYVRNNDNSAWGELKITETDPVWNAEKGSYLRNTAESVNYDIVNGGGTAKIVLQTGGAAPISGAAHGLHIPHGSSASYGTTISARNNALYFRSIEAGEWQPWLRVADRDWIVAQGYLTGYIETDPTVPDYVKAITTINISNWNTAFGWGNHAGLYVLLAGSYANPSWLTSLAWSKITGAPSIPAAANNGTLTVTGAGIATGSQTFSANQATDATATITVPATNLGTTTTWGEISIPTGSNTTLPTLGRLNIPDGNEIQNNIGFAPYGSFSGATNYPSVMGGGFKFVRSSSTAIGSINIWTPALTGDNDIYYNTGASSTTYNGWKRFASKEWVTSILPSTPNLQQVTDVGNQTNVKIFKYREANGTLVTPYVDEVLTYGSNISTNYAAIRGVNSYGASNRTGWSFSTGLGGTQTELMRMWINSVSFPRFSGGGTQIATLDNNGELGVATMPVVYTSSTSVTVSGTTFVRAALTGDVTASANSNATTIAANAVSNTKLRDSGPLSVIGRSVNSTGDPADINAGTDGHVLRRSGTTLGFGTIGTDGLDDNVITNAKLRDSTPYSVIGRLGGTTGDPADISASATNTVLHRRGTDGLVFDRITGDCIHDNSIEPSKLSLAGAATLLGNPTGAAASYQGVGLNFGLKFVGPNLTLESRLKVYTQVHAASISLPANSTTPLVFGSVPGVSPGEFLQVVPLSIIAEKRVFITARCDTPGQIYIYIHNTESATVTIPASQMWKITSLIES